MYIVSVFLDSPTPPSLKTRELSNLNRIETKLHVHIIWTLCPLMTTGSFSPCSCHKQARRKMCCKKGTSGSSKPKTYRQLLHGKSYAQRPLEYSWVCSPVGGTFMSLHTAEHSEWALWWPRHQSPPVLCLFFVYLCVLAGVGGGGVGGGGAEVFSCLRFRIFVIFLCLFVCFGWGGGVGSSVSKRQIHAYTAGQW